MTNLHECRPISADTPIGQGLHGDAEGSGGCRWDEDEGRGRARDVLSHEGKSIKCGQGGGIMELKGGLCRGFFR